MKMSPQISKFINDLTKEKKKDIGYTYDLDPY